MRNITNLLKIKYIRKEKMTREKSFFGSQEVPYSVDDRYVYILIPFKSIRKKYKFKNNKSFIFFQL